MTSAADGAAAPAIPLLSLKDVAIEYRVEAGVVKAVRGVSFDLAQGESLALIGESGCGKTTLGMGLLRLLPKPARIVEGEMSFRRRDGSIVDLVTLPSAELRDFRWNECAMVFQGALNSLNPVIKVRDHIFDTVRAHRRMARREVLGRAEELMKMVRLDPGRVLNSFPHELSGGMRQRVLIALSLLLDPQLLILDEPTTALDILTQRAIIEVLRDLRQRLGFSMIFISHDLGMAAELADRVATMYAGRIIEQGSVRDIFHRPRHPYTVALLNSVTPVKGDLIELQAIKGAPPSLLDLPSGCKFHPRCPWVQEGACLEEDPRLIEINGGAHDVACHHWQEVELQRQVVEPRA